MDKAWQEAWRQAVGQIWRGSRETLDLVLSCVLAGGHLLIEDVPGIGKTTLARALAGSLGGNFRRVQGTPDLLPGDLLGVSVWHERDAQFRFHPGPIFCDILLVDELNRMPPRTQSALLEAMAEGQVSLDGQAQPLAPGFFCIATQNPHEDVGTYPLPESQRDRFLLRLRLGHPGREDERSILEADGAAQALARQHGLLDVGRLDQVRAQARKVHLAPELREYLLDVVAQTRRHPALEVGASTRAALGWQQAAQAMALLHERGFVEPDDLLLTAVPALAHRLLTRDRQEAAPVVSDILTSTALPR